jgi:DNA-3-methyladenine glycosylase
VRKKRTTNVNGGNGSIYSGRSDHLPESLVQSIMFADHPIRSLGEFSPLPESFYARGALEVARDLIGRFLIKQEPGGILVGRIVETEAYLAGDRANHAFRGKTARNAAMFGPPGRAYIYRIYGVHTCLNVVTGPEGVSEAVLLRALEPVEGLGVMLVRRRVEDVSALAAGPGNLCRAFDMGMEFNGEDLIGGSRLRISLGTGSPVVVEARTRIGISHPDAAALPWRFVDPNSACLSHR